MVQKASELLADNVKDASISYRDINAERWQKTE
jgi:hypothetical protein